MPIHCPLKIEQVSTEEFRAIDYAAMNHMFASQNELGTLADEKVYQSDVCKRLKTVDTRSDEEVPIRLSHGTFTKTLSIDLVVSLKAVYELKTVSSLNPSHVSQLLTYLYLLDLPHGKLVNFRPKKVETRFVNAPISREDRCGFSITDKDFRGDRGLLELTVSLIRDWGTSLSISLYQQALVHLLGGKESVEQMLPLNRDGKHLANQRFHLVDNHTAFQLTAFSNPNNNYLGQLTRLLSFSPLRSLEWINIGPQCLTFNTVGKT